uniref:Uncharacterized protein n=1 Tax=Arundo donax TaxID=35708 RepID=A0A0A9BW16_ARUDO
MKEQNRLSGENYRDRWAYISMLVPRGTYLVWPGSRG